MTEAAGASRRASAPAGRGAAPQGERRRRHAQLDGLRAVAVLLVFLHHLDMPRFPGGFLGVDLFFALSGYLITGLLLAEFRRSGRVSFVAFYARRGLRLVPALLVMTLPVLVWAKLDDIGSPLRDGLAGVTYFMDVYAPATHGGGGVFGHTWSLAVEEQFYLVWPVILVCGLYQQWRLTRVLLALIAAFTVVSAICRTELHIGAAELYWSPIPHVAELAAGALLAFALADHPARVRTVLGSPIVALAGVLGLVIGGCYLQEGGVWLYAGGFTLIGLACTALVGHLLTAPEGLASRILSLRPMTWLGERSYAFYLWHYPILLGVSRHTSSHAEIGAIALTSSLAATAISWRYVESPFLRLKARRYQTPVLELRPAAAPVAALG